MHITGTGLTTATGLNVKFWDFLFYASFGFVVTSSVSIAGVLLVFCYLIVPSVISPEAEAFLSFLAGPAGEALLRRGGLIAGK